MYNIHMYLYVRIMLCHDSTHHIQVADGVLTNDSDAFLYGATTVYRDLTTDRVRTDIHVYMYI